ncbi:MAG: hypothetical protein IJX55_04520 [Clostridia bacterium]|nr:hypothetical protein [Clostridia bacterium]
MAESNTLTKREIFEQIKILQKELMECPFNTLDKLADAAETLNESDEAEFSKLCDVFEMREANLERMLKFYEKMYDTAE